MENSDTKAETSFQLFTRMVIYRLMDLSGQINNLVVLHNKLSDQKTDMYTIRALKTAIVSVNHQFLETTLASIASIILQIDVGMDGAPKFVRNLKDYERDYLAEKETSFDGESGNTNTRDRQMTIAKRLYGIPALYASAFDLQCELNKTGIEWMWLKEFIDIRNHLTHPRPGDVEVKRHITLNPITQDVLPTFVLSEADLWKGIYAVLWYLVNVTKVLILPFKNIELPEGLKVTDVLTTDPEKFKNLPDAQILLQFIMFHVTGFGLVMALNSLEWVGPDKQPDLSFYWSMYKMDGVQKK